MKSVVNATLPRRHARSAPLVIAHRGASAEHPENTMIAFRAAWAAGAAWVETDTRPSTDGVPVLIHDADVARTTEGDGPVSAHTAERLAALGVPALRELSAELTGGRRLLLELKDDHTADDVGAVLTDGGGPDVTLLQSFRPDVLRLVQELAPGRPVGLLVEDLDDDPVQRCAALGASAYNPDHQALLRRPEVVRSMRTAGLAVCAWTCDDPAAWAALTDAGVDGIITNVPTQLLAWQAGHRAVWEGP